MFDVLEHLNLWSEEFRDGSVTIVEDESTTATPGSHDHSRCGSHRESDTRMPSTPCAQAFAG